MGADRPEREFSAAERERAHEAIGPAGLTGTAEPTHSLRRGHAFDVQRRGNGGRAGCRTPEYVTATVRGI